MSYTANELNLYIVSMDKSHKCKVDQKRKSEKNTYSMIPFILTENMQSNAVYYFKTNTNIQ